MWPPTMWHPNTRRPRRARTAPLHAQAGLRLCWSHIPHRRKSHALAQITFIVKSKKQITAKQSKANLKQKAKNKTRHNTEGIHIQEHPISGAALGTAGMTLPPASCLEDCSRSGEPRTWMTSDHTLWCLLLECQPFSHLWNYKCRS